ncbi:MAG: translational GTPase TypA, partial [Chlamydiae bacterium]|nr:translational GTPase TypA [Chlamydiota bacterium]
TMRREGFEFAISKPRVIFKENEGQKLEPFEMAHIEVKEEFSGGIIEELSKRKGDLVLLETNEHGITTLQFRIPTRGLMGFRNEFLTRTKGEGILTSMFESYLPFKGEIPARPNGAMISSATGKCTGYSLFNLQDRGVLFVGPTDDVYEGMIVGEHSRDNDLVVNVTKEKQLTNVRSSGNDENIVLTPARRFSLEQAIDFIEADELIEITPKSIRIRKRELKEVDRKRKRV